MQRLYVEPLSSVEIQGAACGAPTGIIIRESGAFRDAVDQGHLFAAQQLFDIHQNQHTIAQ
jgi:hypothetical protein